MGNILLLFLTKSLYFSLATATHNFKWMKITHICLICKSRCLNTDLIIYGSDSIG